MPALSQNFMFNTGRPPSKSTSITFPAGSKGQTLTYISFPLKGDGYYGGNGHHTVTYIPWAKQPRNPYTPNNFVGSIIIQATLEHDPSDGDWFDVSSTFTVFNEQNYNNTFHNFKGNYVWIRAKVTISEGVLTQILYNH